MTGDDSDMRYSVLILALAMACGSAAEPIVTPIVPIIPSKASKVITVRNYLPSQTTLMVDGTPYGSLRAGSSSTPVTVALTLPFAAKTAVFSIQPQTYGSGEAVPSDLVGDAVALPTDDGTLAITNVSGGQSYFFPVLTGPSSAELRAKYGTDTVSFDVGSTTSRRCLGSVLGNLAVTSWGYYRLTGDATMRLFAGPVCSTARVKGSWSTTTLATMEINSGRIALSY